MIASLGLGAYYAMPAQRAPADAHKLSQVNPEDLDSAAFIAEFTTSMPDGRRRAAFAIDSLRCFACLWLCQGALNQLVPSVTVAINLEKNLATVDFPADSTPLSRCVGVLASLGYQATPVPVGTASMPRDDLLRLALALFCLLNVMSFSAAAYLAGLDGLEIKLDQAFRWLSLGLATATIFYAARPLLLAAARAARVRRVVIDQPLMTAMVVAYAYSCLNTIRGSGPIYFDSVIAVLALVLVGRYTQRLLLVRAERKLAGLADPTREMVQLVDAHGIRLAPLRDLKEGQRFLVPPGGLVLTDARVSSDRAAISREPLTGEAQMTAVAIGDSVPAGAINGATPLYCTAERDAFACYAIRAKDLAQRMFADKGSLATWCDRLAVGFFALTLAVATIALFLGWTVGAEEGIGRAVAVLLVACPCVFGFAAPLTFATCAARASQRGVVFRSQRAVEQLAAAKRMVFDKTGTLTLGRPKVTAGTINLQALWTMDLSEADLIAELRALKGQSAHHALLAICDWAEQCAQRLDIAPLSRAPVTVTEDFGAGLHFQFMNGPAFRLGKRSFCVAGERDDGQTWLAVNQHLVLSFTMQDELRSEARAVCDWLRKGGCEVAILSGDEIGRTRAIATGLGIALDDTEGGRSPAGKALSIKRATARGPVAMIGNGFNDAVALGQAAVGIAVYGAMPAAQTAADVVLIRDSLDPLMTAVAISRAATKALRRSFWFSGLYNVMTMTLAATGHVSPLVAALLMPVNSLVVTAIVTGWQTPQSGNESVDKSDGRAANERAAA